MKPSVLVIGGGAAGITATLRLGLHGFPVTLLEERQELGGHLADHPLVLFGWHRETLNLVDLLGTKASIRFSDRVRIEFAGKRSTRLRRPPIPGPWHGLLGLALFHGLSARDRLRALNQIEQAWEESPPLPRDLDSRSAQDWLAQGGQSKSAQRNIWSPLARFLLGDDLARVSAHLLVHLFIQCFLSSRKHSTLAIPGASFQSLILDPAHIQFMNLNISLHMESSATEIRIKGDHIEEVIGSNGKKYRADWYVFAISPRSLLPLIPERTLARYTYFHQLSNLHHVPMVIVHVTVSLSTSHPRLLLLVGRTFHWVVHTATRSSMRDTALISVVATNQDPLLHLDDPTLTSLAFADLKNVLPHFHEQDVQGVQIVREPHGPFCPLPGSTMFRPLPQSPIPNLLLAGDWTDTNLPSSLEGAIRSGKACADIILREVPSHHPPIP